MQRDTAPQAPLTHARRAAQRVLGEVAKVYVGPATRVESLMVALLSGGHVLLEGVPGVAKTTLVKTFARTLDCGFRRIQFTPDLLPADVTGTYVLDPSSGRFTLRKGPIFANIVLGDEINRAPAKTQAALLEAMQERQVTVEGETCPLPSPFMVLVTQNPIEQEGVYPLPEAQLDRFLLKVQMGYPTEDHERTLLLTHGAQDESDVDIVLHPEEVEALRERVGDVHVDPGLAEYVLGLVRHTRERREVELGASPRAGLMLLKAARSRALLHGRDYVLPDDVRRLAEPVLAHRILLSPEAEMDGATSGDVVQAALGAVPFAHG